MSTLVPSPEYILRTETTVITMEGQERDHNFLRNNQSTNRRHRSLSRRERPIPFAICHIDDDGQPRVITRDGRNITREILGDYNNTEEHTDGRDQGSGVGSAASQSSTPHMGRGDRPGTAQPISRRHTTHPPSNVQRPLVIRERIVLLARSFSQPRTPLRNVVNMSEMEGRAGSFLRVPDDPYLPRDQANRERRLRSRRIRMEYELLRGELGIAFPSPTVVEWVREDISRELGLVRRDTDSERVIDPARR